MKIKLLIQYSDRNPTDYADMGFVEMDEAISAYMDFDWDEQMKITEERIAQKLSASRTHMIFRNVEKDESMIIYGSDSGNAEICFQIGKKSSTTLIDGDNTKMPESIDVVDFIMAFFQNNLELELTHEDSNEEELTGLGHSSLKIDLLKRSWILLIPLLVAILMGVSLNPVVAKWFFISMYSFFLLVNLPFLIVFTQYQLKPKVKSANFNFDDSSLTLNYKNQKIIIPKTEIQQLVYTYFSNYKATWSFLSNISITSKDKRQFFITTLTFNDDELRYILRKLNVHYYSFDKLLPLINTRVFSVEANLNAKDYADKKDLEKLYKEYSDTMLQEIIKNKNLYQPDAVLAAKKELELRK